jgi:hypothetical protein
MFAACVINLDDCLVSGKVHSKPNTHTHTQQTAVGQLRVLLKRSTYLHPWNCQSNLTGIWIFHSFTNTDLENSLSRPLDFKGAKLEGSE